jgi:hypothetical protein
MNYVYDIETFPDIFCAVFKNTQNNKILTFEISSRINQWEQLKYFLQSEDLKLIGFNNIAFDYPVLHKMLNSNKSLTSLEIHHIAQEIINEENSSIWYPLIPQLDLYLIHHYNNSARRTSLKYLEFSLRWKKVQDLPFVYNAKIFVSEFDNIIDYCINDVEFTHHLFEKSKTPIDFRIRMSSKLNHNVMNYSDVKIGEYINRITYEKLSGRNYKNFKDERTYHSGKFYLKDIIPNDISFKSKIFQDFFDELQTASFNRDEDLDRYINLSNLTIKFAKGGLHSEDLPRIVKNTKGYLCELDIGSLVQVK